MHHKPRQPPAEQTVRTVHFHLRRPIQHWQIIHKGGSYVLGNPVLNTTTDATITSRPISVVNTTSGVTTALDMIVPTATFTCAPGDTGTIVQLGDINASGQGTGGPPFPWTAPAEAPPPPPVPGQQTVVGVNFTPDAGEVLKAKKAS